MPSKSPRIFGLLVLAGLTLLLSGCISSILANIAIKAPNQQQTPRVVRDAAYAARFDGVCARSWRLSVGPPAAELAVEVVEPGNYQFTYSVEVKQNEQGFRWLEPKYDWKKPETFLPVKGTLILLHGYRDTRENVMHWALCLAEFGYRCVLVDLRGHGRSTGDQIGFGAFEVHDLQQLLDDLQKRGLMGDRAGMLGVSYGASMSLLLAAQDRRVGAIVALEPFSSAAKALVEFAHGVAPQQAAGISAADFAAAVDKASARGKFSWASGDVLAAMDRISAPVLFYHGAKDTWISPDNSRALQARARGPSRLVILPEDDHIWLATRLDDHLVPEVREWFDRYLAPAPTPGSVPASASNY